jgi:hypothetical protein
MLISCSASERWLTSSSTCESLCRGMMVWNSDGMVLWLKRRQNRDVVEWCGEWPRLRWAVECGSRAVREGGLLWWYGFNDLVLVQKGKRHDEALPKAEAASSSWFNGNEAWYGAALWQRRSVGLTRILLGQKIKKNLRDRFSYFKWMVKI